jgi:hypothetical protein
MKKMRHTKMEKNGENRSFFGIFSACGGSFSLAFGREEGKEVLHGIG